MRAAALRAGRVVVRNDVPEPQPGPGQVLVQVKACGICGSDLHFASHGATMLSLASGMGGVPDTGREPLDLGRDVFLGHEFAAEVLEPGPDTAAPAAGTPVTSMPVLLQGDQVLRIPSRRTSASPRSSTSTSPWGTRRRSSPPASGPSPRPRSTWHR